MYAEMCTINSRNAENCICRHRRTYVFYVFRRNRVLFLRWRMTNFAKAQGEILQNLPELIKKKSKIYQEMCYVLR